MLPAETITGSTTSKSIMEHLHLIDVNGLWPISGNSFTFSTLDAVSVGFPTAASGYIELPDSWLLGSELNAVSTVFEDSFKLEDVSDPNEFEVYYSLIVQGRPKPVF